MAMVFSTRWTVFVGILCAQCSFALVSHSPLQSPSKNEAESELVSAIDRNTRAAAEAVVDVLSGRLDQVKADIASQLEDIQTDLESQLDRLEARLMTRIRRLQTQVDDVTSQVTSQVRDTQTAITAEHRDFSVRLLETQTQMESAMALKSDSMFSRLMDVQSQMLTALLTPCDCSDLPSSAKSGIYLLWPSRNRAVPAYCDLDTAGGDWTVIQRRADITPRTSFDLGWEGYGRGFGALLGEFWWGNENLFRLTSIQGRHYELRIELESPDGEERTATYRTFRVASVTDGYRLTASGYYGDAGDSLSASSGQKFSTRDRDQDTSEDNCAALWEAGWWYAGCPHSNVNGLYVSAVNSSSLYGVVWPAWQQAVSLKVVEMKIRPAEAPGTGVVVEPLRSR